MALIKIQPSQPEEIRVPFDKPYLLKGFCRDMYALDKWKDTNYLRNKFNNVKVDVEIYKDKKDFQTSKSSMKGWRFNEYLDNLDNPNSKYYGKTYVPDCDLMGYEGYIHGDIYKDVINPREVMDLQLKNGDGDYGIPDACNLYIGRDTKTGMHCHIEDDFMLNQIIGKKRIYCLDFEHLTINSFFSIYTNFSRENFFEMDWDKMDIYYAELEPGDSFCFPPWYWHAVESDDYTIGITKVWERNDQWEVYKSHPKYLPLKRRFWFSSMLPKLFIEFARKYFR